MPQTFMTLVAFAALSFTVPAFAEDNGESDSGPSPSVSVGLVGAFTGIDSDSSDSVQKQGLSSDRKFGWGLAAGLDSPMGPVSLAISAMYVRRIFEIGNSTLRIEREVPTLFVPLELRLWLGNAFYVGGGVFGSIRVGDQKDKILSGSNTLFSFSSGQRNDFEYGFAAAAGLTIPIYERTGIALEGKYLYGLKDAAKDSTYEEKIRDLAFIAGLRFSI